MNQEAEALRKQCNAQEYNAHEITSMSLFQKKSGVMHRLQNHVENRSDIILHFYIVIHFYIVRSIKHQTLMHCTLQID